MTDLSESFDFTAATNAAIAEAEGVAPEVVEEAPEAAEAVEASETTERPRDEAGRFVAEPAEETAPAVDAASELEALRKRLADKDEFIDRQGNEIGELRKAFEDGMTDLSGKINAPAPQRVSEDLIDRDPAAATQQAWNQGDQATLGVAFSAWKEYDPAAAGAWAAYTASQQQIAEIREQHAKDLAALEARVAPIAAHNADEQTAARVREVAGKYGADTIAAFAQSDAFAELATEFPWATEGLQSDPAGTLESLFLVHRGRTADTHTRTAEAAARETAEQTAQATDDAFVASASTATATSAEPKTEADLIREGMTARIQHRDSVWRDGWTHG